MGDNSHTAYHQRLTLIRRYCWMKWPGPTLHDRVHETGSIDMQVVLHKGGWRVYVSPTLVESNLTMAGRYEGYNNKLDKSPLWFRCVGKNGSC